MRDSLKYLVIPGIVRSINDGDIHFIGYNTLIRLYGVNPKECIPGSYLDIHKWQNDYLIKKHGLIVLGPRSDGDYRLKNMRFEYENIKDYIDRIIRETYKDPKNRRITKICLNRAEWSEACAAYGCSSFGQTHVNQITVQHAGHLPWGGYDLSKDDSTIDVQQVILVKDF